MNVFIWVVCILVRVVLITTPIQLYLQTIRFKCYRSITIFAVYKEVLVHILINGSVCEVELKRLKDEYYFLQIRFFYVSGEEENINK